MPISSYPVVVPYRAPGATGPLSTLQVSAIAADATAAVAEARLIATHWMRLRGGGAIEPTADRIKCGTPAPQPDGPHLYLLSRLDRVHAIGFPARIDSEPGERLGETLAGFDAGSIHAVIFVCHRLGYINTIGLTALAAHVKRLPLHLCGVPAPVQRVFDIVGLTTYLAIHPDLGAALAAVRPAD